MCIPHTQGPLLKSSLGATKQQINNTKNGDMQHTPSQPMIPESVANLPL
jgi:hypothetical protein